MGSRQALSCVELSLLQPLNSIFPLPSEAQHRLGRIFCLGLFFPHLQIVVWRQRGANRSSALTGSFIFIGFGVITDEQRVGILISLLVFYPQKILRLLQPGFWKVTWPRDIFKRRAIVRSWRVKDSGSWPETSACSNWMESQTLFPGSPIQIGGSTSSWVLAIQITSLTTNPHNIW